MLEEQVDAGVDEEAGADRVAGGGDALGVEADRMEAGAADHLVLEIAADRAGAGEHRDVARAFVRIGGIGAFEIDRHRQVDRRDDPRGIGQRQLDRQALGILEAVRRGHRPAAGGDRRRAGIGDRFGAARRPRR